MSTDTYSGNPPQQGDVFIFHTLDGGDIKNARLIVGPRGGFYGDGVIEMTTNFDSMVYLTLYGGNVDDPGGDDKTKQWWGNFTEPDPAKHYRSEFQFIIDGLPASSSNLLLLEQAATRDLEKAFVQTKIADTVKVTATIPKRNQVSFLIEIEAQGNRSEYTFTENWENSL